MQISQEPSKSASFQTLKNRAIVGLIVGSFIIVAVYLFGSHDSHQDSNHFLYDCFYESPEHIALERQLHKRKLSIIFGRKEDGLFHFAEHYANELSLIDQNVFIQDISKSHFKLYRIAKNTKTLLDSWFGLEKKKGDWIIQSRDGTIVTQDTIDKIRQGNSHSKIIIVTTSRRQRNPGFKEFEFPQINQHEIEESIQRNYHVSENTADILFDYFETPENVFDNMKFDSFDSQQFLGDNYRSLQGLSRQEVRILKDLCKKGQGHSQKESLALTQLGVVHYKGENYWKNPQARLNYELHKGLNCKNKLISDDILREVQEIKEREAQQEREKYVETQQTNRKKYKGKKRNKKNFKVKLDDDDDL